MTDESNETSESLDVAESSVIDAISDVVSGVPTPIKKNALKAFAQLCTAAIDIPVAYLEGIAAEKRAETAARIKIINTSADQISKQMDVDPEYSRVAVKKYGEKIVREQVNLDVISANAAQELAQAEAEGTDETEDSQLEDISNDWLNIFEKEACNKSSDEMRLLFGKILAGEIRKPSSYSIKTIKLLSQLDNQAAKIFQRLCSLCISLQAGDHIIDARVVSLSGSAASNSLRDFGLGFADLNILQEYGLIISDYNSYMDYDLCIANSDNIVTLAFNYQGAFFGLIPRSNKENQNKIRLNGVALSQSGKELLNIIDVDPNEKYTNALKEYFSNKNFDVVELTS